jgi:hypothetical protein
MKILMWGAIILLVTYMMNVNAFAFIGAVIHVIQQLHNTNAGH